MSVDVFSKEQFEKALPTKADGSPLWEYVGIIQNEHVYQMKVNGTNKRICIRSSVAGNTDMSAPSGGDSIRLWVEYYYKDEWRPLKKLDSYTKRTPGWEKRMVTKLRKLWKLALEDSSRNHYNSSQNLSSERPSKVDKLNVAYEQRSEADTEEIYTQLPNPSENGSANTEESQEADSEDSSDEFNEYWVRMNNEFSKRDNDYAIQDGHEPNPEQKLAINAPIDSAIRVLAPPGAGKTFVIGKRNLFLIEQGVSSSHILNVTFSKSMADDGKERVVKEIKKAYPDLGLDEFERWFCTIHALCYRILKENGDTRNVAKNWQIKRAIQDIAESIWPYAEERPGWKEIFYWIAQPKFNGLSSSEDLGYYLEALGEFHGRNLHEARRLFDAHMKHENLLTFSDMLYDVEYKLNHDRAFCEKWQARFEVVNIDEGQDTSGQAMRILTKLAAPQNQVMIVGDTDQLLFRFAGATPEQNLYNGFEAAYPDGLLVKMKVNYRSTKAIIDACNRLISNNYGENAPYDKKYKKDILPREGATEGNPITFQLYDTAEDEAKAVVESIIEQLDNGREPGDIFVGARTKAQLGYIEGPLVRAKVPFINATGGSFWASKHVADVVAYLAIAFDERDKKAFQRVYNIASNWNVHPWGKQEGEYCPHRYLGRAFLAACGESYTNVWSAACQKHSWEPGIRDLTSFVNEVKVVMQESHVIALRFIIENCYEKYLQAEEGLESIDEAENGKLEDLATVIDVASQFDTTQEFLDYVDEMVRAAEAAREKDWSQHVVISTVHRLKGLERDVVFGIGLAQGLLPHRFAFEPPPQRGVLPVGGMALLEDERDICFVLISRAKQEVHLSSMRFYRGNNMFISQFIGELGIDYEEISNVEPRM